MTDPALSASTSEDASINEGWVAVGACNRSGFTAFKDLQKARLRTNEVVALYTCEGCVVREACLEYALAKAIVGCVWGGKTPAERKLLRAARNGGYDGHRRELKDWQRRSRLKALVDRCHRDGESGLMLTQQVLEQLADSLGFTARHALRPPYVQLELFIDEEVRRKWLTRTRVNGLDYIKSYEPPRSACESIPRRLAPPPVPERRPRPAAPVAPDIDMPLPRSEVVMRPIRRPPQEDMVAKAAEDAKDAEVVPVGVQSPVEPPKIELPVPTPAATPPPPKKAKARSTPVEVARAMANDGALPKGARQFWARRLEKLEAAHKLVDGT